MQRFTTLALMLAMASKAYADDPTESYARRFMEYDHLRETVDHGGHIGPAAGDCTKDIAKAKAEGVPADAMFTIWLNSKKVQMSFDDIASKICAPYERAFEVQGIEAAVEAAWQDLDWLKMIDIASNHPENAVTLAKDADACIKAVARVDAMGIGDREHRGVHLDEAKEKICDPLAKAAATFASDVKNAAAAAEAEAQAPFKAVGIKGDKLFTCTQYHVLRGVGGWELEAAQIKKAKVLFALQGGDEYGWTLYRFTFKGDKLVGTTSRNYVLRPGPKAFK
jgi:hypothetical protein